MSMAWRCLSSTPPRPWPTASNTATKSVWTWRLKRCVTDGHNANGERCPWLPFALRGDAKRGRRALGRTANTPAQGKPQARHRAAPRKAAGPRDHGLFGALQRRRAARPLLNCGHPFNASAPCPGVHAERRRWGGRNSPTTPKPAEQAATPNGIRSQSSGVQMPTAKIQGPARGSLQPP